MGYEFLLGMTLASIVIFSIQYSKIIFKGHIKKLKENKAVMQKLNRELEAAKLERHDAVCRSEYLEKELMKSGDDNLRLTKELKARDI